MNEKVPLHRASTGRMVAGVAAGLAAHFGASSMVDSIQGGR
jgi:phage shock protein PspC (stress-responsive transcriptional regulator)